MPTQSVIHPPSDRDTSGAHWPRDQRHVETFSDGRVLWWWEKMGPCDRALRETMLEDKTYDVRPDQP